MVKSTIRNEIKILIHYLVGSMEEREKNDQFYVKSNATIYTYLSYFCHIN